ncbi:MAG: transporter [Deltaproteobacteria bacterium]|nr:transporter [Deltaproteobacteria bacterium]
MSSLISNHVFLLFVIIILGEGLGRIRIKSFSFGSAAIIFVAMAFGHFGYTLPVEFQTLGLVLFIYTVAVSAGPGFFKSFKKQGLTLAIGAIIIIVVAALMTVLCCWLFGFDVATGVGLFAGALTSSPGLAVAVEAVGGNSAAAYGVTYAGGIICIIVFVNMLPRILRVDVGSEEAAMDKELTENYQPFTFHHIEVTNSNLFGKKIVDIKLRDIAPVVLTRLLRKGATEPLLVNGETILQEGDHLRIAGRENDLERIELFLGKAIAGEIAFNKVLTKKRIIVSKPRVAGTTLGFFNLRETFGVQVTRISRNGIDLSPSMTTRLHLGDIVHVVGEEDALKNVSRILGNDMKQTYNVSFLPILIGLVAGFLFGQIPFDLPLIGRFSFGITGGVLISGLILGHLYKTGPFIWEMPTTANDFLRELGLMFFLATVGTKTGATIVATVIEQGPKLVVAGLIVTITPMVFYVIIGRCVQKIPFLRMLGVLTGGMTSTPGLAAANSYTSSSYPASAYATVYPVGLIGMILATKALVFVLSAI